jgi:DNA processing protein
MTSLRLRRLLREAGSPGQAWGNLSGEQAKEARKLDLDMEMARLVSSGIRLVARRDAGYPPALAAIYDAPELLFLSGTRELPAADAVAIVGSRKASSYGRDVAEALGRELSEYGVTVVSGAACGIDGAAHRGALRAAGNTVAVLGCGIDRVYPPQHRALFEDIRRNGCLVSEYPPGTAPLRHHFPERNRIIAGLSRGVVVVEAAERSGALITVDFALQEGRDVFAVPGQVGSPLAASPHRLIQEGAKLVTCATDILEEYGHLTSATSASAEVALTADEKRIVALIEVEGCFLDDLLERTGLGPGRLAETLTRLQVAGLVREEPGKRYARSLLNHTIKPSG